MLKCLLFYKDYAMAVGGRGNSYALENQLNIHILVFPKPYQNYGWFGGR